jgi:hypothetical protein
MRAAAALAPACRSTRTRGAAATELAALPSAEIGQLVIVVMDRARAPC